MHIIGKPSKINLETKLGTPIENWFDDDALPYDAEKVAKEHVKKYGVSLDNKLRVLTRNSRYNCHGLVFANRRTGITEEKEMLKILQEDGYRKINLDELMPGDIVLFKDQADEYSHTALVLEMRRVGTLSAPILISKWGFSGEWLHDFYNHPYSNHRKEYWTDRPKLEGKYENF